MRFLPVLLRRAIRKGSLAIAGPDGRVWRFGDGSAPAAAIRISDPSFAWRIFLIPELHAAEAFMDGALTMEQGDLLDLL